MRKYFYFLLLSLSFTVGALEQLCSEKLAKVPTLAGGRVKPLYVLAKESNDFIFSEKPKMDDTSLFCKLSLITLFDFAEKDQLLIKVEHPEAKKFLNLDAKDKGISIEKLVEKEDQVKEQYRTLVTNDALKKEYNKILLRLQSFAAIVNGEAWTIQNTKDPKTEDWIPVKNFISDWKNKDLQIIENDLLTNSENYLTNHPAALAEYYYFKIRPYVIALLLSLFSIIALVTLPKDKTAKFLTLLTLILQIAAITTRIYISGRAPITNMYETVIFSGFGALVISVILFLNKKEKLYLLAGLSYNVLTLLMSIFANNMLSPAISPLVPVLRDNFWLSTHVTTVILSYAALSVSWMLANLVLLQKTFNFKIFSHYQEKMMAPLIHNSVKIGVVLLSTGVILGGIWADYSWGRFWGWDPKETWSLIVLLIYMAILHGKYTSWITPQRFIPLIALAFLSVMFAWFGVNYILASGLHSYGFSEGGAIFLMSFFIIQITLLVLHYFRNKKLLL